MNIYSSPFSAFKSKLTSQNFIPRQAHNTPPTISPQDVFTPSNPKLEAIMSDQFGKLGNGKWETVLAEQNANDKPPEPPVARTSSEGYRPAPESQARLLTRAQEQMRAIEESQAKARAERQETMAEIARAWRQNREQIAALRDTGRNRAAESSATHLNSFLAFIRTK